MNSTYVSLTLTRRYVTELVRSPRAAATLAPRPRRGAPAAPATAAPAATPPAPRLTPPRV